jgi:flagellar hook-basal body complex protein FliE
MNPVTSIASTLMTGLRPDSGAASTLFTDPTAGLANSETEATLAAGQTESDAGSGSVAPAFGAVLSQFLGKVDSAQHGADAMVESLALGEPVDVHQVMLALNEAADALHLTLAVRGKILDAYAEVMRTAI